MGIKNWSRKMTRKKGAIRPSTQETAEKNAIAHHHACMCGCGKGYSVYKDEPTDANEKLDRQTLDEIRQQQQGLLAYADPVDVLIYHQMVQSGEIDPGDEEQGEGVSDSPGVQMS